MKRFFLLIAVVLIAVFVTSLSIGTQNAQAADKVYRMKIQSAYPRGDLSMELLKDFAKSANKRSKGRIRIQVFADPELVPAEQLFEATQKGTLDMLHAVAAMWGGIVPVGEVEFGLPYAYNLPGHPDVYQSAEIIRNFFLKTGFKKKIANYLRALVDIRVAGQIVGIRQTELNFTDRDDAAPHGCHGMQHIQSPFLGGFKQLFGRYQLRICEYLYSYAALASFVG